MAMIAFLPLWILGVPLVLALIDLMATRSGARDDVEYETSPAGRYTGVRGEVRRSDELRRSEELRRGEESSPVVGTPVVGTAPVTGNPAYRPNTPANMS
jgi:hypothetical protein